MGGKDLFMSHETFFWFAFAEKVVSWCVLVWSFLKYFVFYGSNLQTGSLRFVGKCFLFVSFLVVSH